VVQLPTPLEQEGETIDGDRKMAIIKDIGEMPLTLRSPGFFLLERFI